MWRISAICAEGGKKKNPTLTSLNPLWLTVDILHHGNSSGWTYLSMMQQTPSGYSWERSNKHQKITCKTLLGSGELPTPEPSSASSLQEFEHKRAHCPTPPRVHSAVDVLSHSVCSCRDVADRRDGRIGRRVNIRVCLRHWHLDSNDTAPHPKPYSTDSLDCSLSLCISLHTAGRDGSLTERDVVEVHLILNCDVIFLTLEKSLLSYV